MTFTQHAFVQPLIGDGAVLPRGARLLHTRRPGRLTVASGHVWLTRRGDLDDHVLSAGQTLALRADEQVVVEPWVEGTAARLAWCGDQPPALVLRAAEALRVLRAGLACVLAGALPGAGVRLRAWARNAEVSASRAQGSIDRGESSASSGALQ